MPWTDKFAVDHQKRVLSIPFSSFHSESGAIAELLELARRRDVFKVLRGWRDELYPILELSRFDGPVAMERAGSALFGIHTIGVHMTAYTRDQKGDRSIWVPRRSYQKQTYPGMLDNSVAGGIASGEDPFECLLREAGEEASLPSELVRSQAQAVGTISYFHVRDEKAGGEIGLLQPETQYLYDLEIGSEISLGKADDEVEEFYLWNIETVKRALKQEQFKPNCALCLIDFLVRHGEINTGNEEKLAEIVSRMHRRIRFEEAGQGLA